MLVASAVKTLPPALVCVEQDQVKRRILDRLQRLLGKKGRFDRPDAQRRIIRIAEIAKAEFGVVPPPVADGEIQAHRVVKAVSDAAKAVRAAHTAVIALEEDAFESLFGGVVESADVWGDPEKPLSPAAYDLLAHSLKVAAVHLRAAAKRAQPYYDHPRKAGRNRDEWKLNLVIACVGLFRDLGLVDRVRRSPYGPFHSTINDIASLVGLPSIGQSAFYSALKAVGISTVNAHRAISD